MERISEYQDERWKERARQIRELDGHKCALCGATGLLHVHHLSYPPAPFHLWDSLDSELVTLCPDCHHKVHESPTRPYLDEYRNLEGHTEVRKEDTTWEDFHEKIDKLWYGGMACCAQCQFCEINFVTQRVVCKKPLCAELEVAPQHYTCGDFKPEERFMRHIAECGKCKHHGAWVYEEDTQRDDECCICKKSGEKQLRWLACLCDKFENPNVPKPPTDFKISPIKPKMLKLK